MIKRLLENEHLSKQEIYQAVQLDKNIILDPYPAQEHHVGHYCDYLNRQFSLVNLVAKKDSQLVLWDSSNLLSECKNCHTISLQFHLTEDDLPLAINGTNAEAWSADNGCGLQNSEGLCDFSYHFLLLHTHAVTGELLLAPSLFFLENPSYYFINDSLECINELVRAKPSVIPVKQNQIICFDKYHYQFAYNPDFQFVRMTHAH